jgi:hypothetical protein
VEESQETEEGSGKQADSSLSFASLAAPTLVAATDRLLLSICSFALICPLNFFSQPKPAAAAAALARPRVVTSAGAPPQPCIIAIPGLSPSLCFTHPNPS